MREGGSEGHRRAGQRVWRRGDRDEVDQGRALEGQRGRHHDPHREEEWGQNLVHVYGLTLSGAIQPMHSYPRKVRCDYQVANGTSELLAEFERSGEEQILAPGGGFYAFVEDFRGGNARIDRGGRHELFTRRIEQLHIN